MEAAVMKPFMLGLVHANHDVAFTDTATLNDRVGHNTGNLAFQTAVMSHFDYGLETAIWSTPPEKINSMGDVGIIPAANQFGPHGDYGSLVERFEKITSKLVMIGLGAQSDIGGGVPSVPDGTVNWIRQIARHGKPGVPNISVRGDFTKTVLEKYGLAEHAVALGCPSLFINPDPELGQRIAKRFGSIKRIAVVSAHPSWRHLYRIEASLSALVSATGGSYIGQSPLSSIQLTRGEARLMKEDDLRACRDAACPQMDLEEFTIWSQRYGNVFFNISDWMEHYRRFDFVIGARIHGVMLALQAGVPGVCIAHDARTQELCQTMKVPYVLASQLTNGVKREELPYLFDFDAASFDANRLKLAAKYVEFLEGNDLRPVEWLRALGLAGEKRCNHS